MLLKSEYAITDTIVRPTKADAIPIIANDVVITFIF